MSTQSISLNQQLEKNCFEKCIPVHATIELTYRCNLQCRHCYAPKDSDGELSIEELKSIFDQLVKAGTFHLTFTGGEILVRDDFFDIARAAKSRGFFLTLMTNGTLITADNADDIAKLKPKEVDISLYGANAEMHDYVTTVPGSFDLAVQAISHLVSRGVHVIAKIVLMKSNIKQHREIEALAKKLGAVPRISTEITPGKYGSSSPMKYDPSCDDVQSFFKERIRKDKSSEGSPEPSKPGPCKTGRSTCNISPDGRVFPCLLMPIELGSLREKTLSEIWYQNDNKLLNILRSKAEYEASPCLKCELIRFCSRCLGLAYIETGDPFERSSFACRHARWKAEIFRNEVI